MTQWPAGVKTCDLVFPAPLSASGKAVFDTYVTVAMLTPGTGYIVWSGDDTVVVPTATNQRNPIAIAVPAVDQDGWVDQAQVPFHDLSYAATVQHCLAGTVDPVVGPYTVTVKPTSEQICLAIAAQSVSAIGASTPVSTSPAVLARTPQIIPDPDHPGYFIYLEA